MASITEGRGGGHLEKAEKMAAEKKSLDRGHLKNAEEINEIKSYVTTERLEHKQFASPMNLPPIRTRKDEEIFLKVRDTNEMFRFD